LSIANLYVVYLRTGLILLFVAIFLPAYFTENASCPESTLAKGVVTDFEFTLFKWATTKTQECKDFRAAVEKRNEGNQTTNVCKSAEECQRFKQAKSCYDSFYSNLSANDSGKIELDKCSISVIQKACS
jgi:hypothetical protein